MSKPSPVEVFWISGSPYSWRVLLALEVRGIPYTSHLLEASKGAHKAPEYLALNPRGKAPTLKDGGTVVYESLAILQYLERRFPQNPLFGSDAAQTARIWRVISEFAHYLDRPLNRVVFPLFFGKSAEAAADIRAAIGDVHKELASLESGVSKAGWLAGDTLSAADIAVYPFTMTLLRAAGKPEAAAFDLGVLPLSARYPKLAAWQERIQALPGYDRTFPPHWRKAA